MAIIRDTYEIDPYANALFLFCGRKKNAMKALHFDKDGFDLYLKRLDNSRFQWLKDASEVRPLTRQEFWWPMENEKNNIRLNSSFSFVIHTLQSAFNAIGRKAFLFHTSVAGANASAVMYSIIETAKANNFNLFQYLYMVLLYMPEYKNEPAGIENLLPLNDFMMEQCTDLIDVENITAENHTPLQF